MENNLPTGSTGAGVVARAKAILVQPKAEWPKVAAETTEPKSVLLGYAVPLAAIGPVASLIGSLAFGYDVLFTTVRPSVGFAVTTAVTSFVLSLVSLFVIAFVANALSPKFGGKNDWPAAFRLVAYSMTAAWLAGIFGLVPALAVLSLVGLYSIYLFYAGATPVLGIPGDKAATYTAVTVLVAIVVQIVIGAIVAAIAPTPGLSVIAG